MNFNTNSYKGKFNANSYKGNFNTNYYKENFNTNSFGNFSMYIFRHLVVDSELASEDKLAPFVEISPFSTFSTS